MIANRLAILFRGSSQQVKHKIMAIYAVLLLLNIVAWGLTFLVSLQFAFVLGTGLLAYTFGLRHGVDADHIAAIDNITRKLMQEGKRPVAVGFWFSLGHSTVVVALTLVVAFTANFLEDNVPAIEQVGGLVSLCVSASFLYLIGLLNLLVLIDIYRMFRRVTRGGTYNEAHLEQFLDERGLLSRFFKPVMRLIDKSWKMYFLGILFGLGFETAAEIALLGIAASSASSGMPIFFVLIFPLLFAAGMTLVDTTDSVLMLGAYGWAFVKPVRKLYYNLNITLVSVLVAFVIGTVEVLSIIADQFKLEGGFWDWVGDLSFETMGYIIIGLFVLSWLTSTLVYRLKKYDELEVKVNNANEIGATETRTR